MASMGFYFIMIVPLLPSCCVSEFGCRISFFFGRCQHILSMLVQLLVVLFGIFVRKGELTSSTPPSCLLLGKLSYCNFSKWELFKNLGRAWLGSSGLGSLK